MTLQDVLSVADAAYGDGLVEKYHKCPDGNHGDTLAQFVVLELTETFDEHVEPEQAFAVAAGYIESAVGQLERVAEALRERQEECELVERQKGAQA